MIEKNLKVINMLAEKHDMSNKLGQESRGNSFLRNILKKKKMMKIMKLEGKTPKQARRADQRRSSTSLPLSLPGCRRTIKVN